MGWGDGATANAVSHIFCDSSQENKMLLRLTSTQAKYTNRELFKHHHLPKIPVWHELKIREMLTDNWEHNHAAHCLYEQMVLCIVSEASEHIC